MPWRDPPSHLPMMLPTTDAPPARRTLLAGAAPDASCATADVFLMPGHAWFGDDARSLTTLLGSCCAITLWHPRLRAAAMCHYLLPRREAGDRYAPNDALDGRYGDEAIELLRAAVERAGAPLAEYEARVFGGANMFSAFGKSALDIGLRNADQARSALAQLGIAPRSVDVGGTAYRRLRMSPATGNVTVHYGQPR